MRVVFVSPEVAPWSKVGGLGDVLEALPVALAQRGHQVMTVAPLYQRYGDTEDANVRIPVSVPAGVEQPWARCQASDGDAATLADAPPDAQPAVAAAGAGLGGRDSDATTAALGVHTEPAYRALNPRQDACWDVDELVAGTEATTPGSGKGNRVAAAEPGTGPGSGAVAATPPPPPAAAAPAAGDAAVPPPVPPARASCGSERVGRGACKRVGCLPVAAYPRRVTHVRLRHCFQRGVLRVFVEHPLFAVADGNIYSPYTAEGLSRNVVAAFNVLNAVALIAPCLYWSDNAPLRPTSPAAAIANSNIVLPSNLEAAARVGPFAAADAAPAEAAPADVAPPADAAASKPAEATPPDAATEAAETETPVMFVANDWPTALLPLYLQAFQSAGSELGRLRTPTSGDSAAPGEADPDLALSSAAVIERASPAAANPPSSGAPAGSADSADESAGGSPSDACQPAASVGSRPHGSAEAAVASTSRTAAPSDVAPSAGAPAGALAADDSLPGALREAWGEGAAAAAAWDEGHASQEVWGLLSAPAEGGPGAPELDEAAWSALEAFVGRCLQNAKVLLCVHNLAYQGVFPRETVHDLSLPARLFPFLQQPPSQPAAAALGPAAASPSAPSAAPPPAAAATAAASVASPVDPSPSPAAPPNVGRPSEWAAAPESDVGVVPPLVDVPVTAAGSASTGLANASNSLHSCAVPLGSETPDAPAAPGGVARTVESLVASGARPSASDSQRDAARPAPDPVDTRRGGAVAAEAQSPTELATPFATGPRLWGAEKAPPGLQALRRGAELTGRVVNWLAAGLRSAAAAVTVSPNYARLVCTDARQSMGLGGVLEGCRVHGIINGLDTEVWSPVDDQYLRPDMRYDVHNMAEGKQAAKAWVQAQCDLTVDPQAPLTVFIGRLTDQKGVDLLLQSIYAVFDPPAAAPPQSTVPWMGAPGPQQPRAAEGPAPAAAGGGPPRARGAPAAPPPVLSRAQLVVLGTGDAHLEQQLIYMRRSFPGRAHGFVGFNETMAHRLIAAADYLIVPSRFEPCGLVAFCALRYGAVPLVASTGGLLDIVHGRFEDEGGRGAPPLPPDALPGRRCKYGYELGVLEVAREGAAVSAERLVASWRAALADYGSDEFYALRRSCMGARVGWDRPGRAWEQLLRSLADDSADEC